MGKAKDYGIPRAVMYDEDIDEKDPMFDLCRDIIKEGKKEVMVITQDDNLKKMMDILSKKEGQENLSPELPFPKV